MTMVAIPTINQGALPAGSPGISRDDLQLAAPVVVSDSGPGPIRSWVLVDKPDGSLAVLSAASGASTQFTPDVEGSYRVKLEVNGAPDNLHIAHIVAGVQIALPSWISPAASAFFRIPAFGEQLEFNSRSSPSAGTNTRGWALEVNQFLRVLALNAFGIQVNDGGVPVPGEFRTVNFLNTIVTNAGGGVLDVEPLPDTGSGEAGYPRGVVDINDSQLSWNDATKTLTHSMLAPAASFRIYEVGGGVRLAYDFTVAQSVAIAVPAYGLWWFYYEGGVFKTAQTLPDGFRSTIVAAVYLNAAHNAIAVLDERHGISMPWATHEYLHTTIGTRFDNGFGLSRVAAGNGGADGDAEIIITGGTIWDEDIRIQITRSAAPVARFEQELGEFIIAGQIPLYYRTGLIGTWEKLTATSAPLHQLGAGQRPVYNRLSMGGWDLFTISANARYTICYVCATSNLGNVDGAGYLCEPVFAILGQGDYTLGDAQNASFADLQLGGFFTNEVKPLYKLIYRVSNSYANTYKAYLYEFTDLRNVAPLPGTSFVATDHQSLSGRTTPGAHPATAIAVNAAGFVGNLATTDDNLQLVSAVVDGLIIGVSSVPEAATIFVTKNGNDATGIRGDRSKPYLTITAAFAVAQSGDLVLIGPGTFAEAGLVIPNIERFHVRGSGIGVTILDLASGFLRDTNSKLDVLTFEHFTVDTTGGVSFYIDGQFYAGGYCAAPGYLSISNVEDISRAALALDSCVYIVACGNSKIENCHFNEDCGLLNIVNFVNVEVNNCFCKGTSTVAPKGGFRVENSLVWAGGIVTVKNSEFQTVFGAIRDGVNFYMKEDCLIVSSLIKISPETGVASIGGWLSGSYTNSTIEIYGYADPLLIAVTLDGVHDAAMVKVSGVSGSDVRAKIRNSSIETLLILGNDFGGSPIIVTGCQSCLPNVTITGHILPEQPSNFDVNLYNCTILFSTVDGPHIINAYGGACDVASRSMTNLGQLVLWAFDFQTSAAYG